MDNGKFVIDLNYPGVIYTFPSSSTADRGIETMYDEGCNPRKVHNTNIKDKNGPWSIKEAPAWWYGA